MKNLKRRISLLLALLLALNLLPGGLLAEAADGAYTVLLEPGLQAGVCQSTYGNAAVLWVAEDVYYLAEYTGSEVMRVTDGYGKMEGLSQSGYANARHSANSKWGVVDATGQTVVDFVYDDVEMPSDDGYAVAWGDAWGYVLLDLRRNSRHIMPTLQGGDQHIFNNGLTAVWDWAEDGGIHYVDIYSSTVLPGPYAMALPFSNGYAAVRTSGDEVYQIITASGEVVLNDASAGGAYTPYGCVSAEGLIRVRAESGEYGYGYMDLTGRLVIPCQYEYLSRDFRNGYAVVQNNDYEMGLIDAKGNVVVPFGLYDELSDVSSTGLVWAVNEKGYNEETYEMERVLAAVLQVPVSSSGSGSGNTAPSEEYIYNVPDPGASLELPAEWLEDVVDIPTAVEAVNDLVYIMSEEQKTAPTGIDLATLFAETAAARASVQAVSGGDIPINAALLSGMEDYATQASAAVEAALNEGGVATARYLSSTAVLTTDETNVTISIAPDVLSTAVDKVRVETPAYALTFKLKDLEPDLTHTLVFSAGAVGSAARTEAGGVNIMMPDGGTTNSITLSLPRDAGDTTYQALVSGDGAATASKYNPATTLIDGKVNSSGTYYSKKNQVDFSDISNKSKEMQDAIRYLASKGIINGRTPTTFEPDGSINRAEIATLLTKALGKLSHSATTTFADVPRDSWYYPAAASSQRHKLIGGFEDNTFRGTTNINKVQIVAVSSRVLTTEMKYKTPGDPSAYLTRYADSIAAWAQPEVALATRENLVVYRTDGTFSGDRDMTRGDAAIIIYRLFQKIW